MAKVRCLRNRLDLDETIPMEGLQDSGYTRGMGSSYSFTVRRVFSP